MKNFVYIVSCADKSLYTGTAIDLKQRIKKHNQGQGAKYTRTRRPVRLVYFEVYDNLISARKRENQIKSLRKADKILLINSKRRNKKKKTITNK